MDLAIVQENTQRFLLQLMLAYNLLVRLYGFIIRCASLRNDKAGQWVRGRKNWRKILREQAQKISQSKKVWVHCASYGEFEQGRPLIEAIKLRHPDYKIILSFFSPSGYEEFKNWSGADIVCYIPLDTKNNARDFIEIVKPDLALFIKYEFWVNFLNELKKQAITTYLISAVFKPHHPFFKVYGTIFRRSLQTFTRLYVQDASSAQLLENIGVTNYEICGDTRFDRVLEIKNRFKEISELKEFKGTSKLIIGGSTWPKDEELLLTAFSKMKNTNVKLMLVPHNIDEKSIIETEHKLRRYNLTYSRYTKGVDSAATVLILDTMGMLSRTYHYADCAYIGGGFNGGMHNGLEAAVYEIPIAFYGDDYVNYNEAVDILKIQSGGFVKNPVELAETLNRFLFDETQRKKIADGLKLYFQQNSNVTEKILTGLDL
jgi:3-deoxy-D-manno-octulosonic-acid transferase